MEKDHSVTVTINSSSFGITNSELRHTEYASCPEELVYKHYAIADAILKSLTGNNDGSGGAIREMSNNFLKVMEESGGDLEKVLNEKVQWKRKGK